MDRWYLLKREPSPEPTPSIQTFGVERFFHLLDFPAGVSNQSEEGRPSCPSIFTQFDKPKNAHQDFWDPNQCSFDMGQLLSSLGADIDSHELTGTELFYMAISNNSSELIDFLLKNQANVNIPDDNGYTPLCIAAKIGNVDMIKRLVNGGACVNHRTPEGFSVLYIAVRNSNEDAAFLLKDLGGKVCCSDVLHAADTADTRVLKLLQKIDTDFNVRDPSGLTPLYHAVVRNADLVRRLIALGADVNIKYPLDRTALHRAASDGHHDSVVSLVESGADKNPKDTWGMTPLSLAIKYNHLKTADYLKLMKAD